MTRYFFTDPLAAAWMQKHFGMRFVTPHGEELRWHDGKMMFGKPYPVKGTAMEDKTLLIESRDRHFIHPDSVALLEPQDLDIIYRTNGYCQTVGVHIGIPKTLAQLAAGAVIIMRDGKPFHWPMDEP